MKALGAEIVRTKDDAKYDSDESHIGKAFKLRKEIPDSVVLDQYLNVGNPMAHYEGTANEIIDALGGNVQMVVIGVGTGGSVTGIARRMREKCPGCEVIGVDPIGSVIGGDDNGTEDGDKHGHFEVEGIGYDFVPTVLDMDLIGKWEKVIELTLSKTAI